jgi:hypothetical protein
MCHTSSKVSIAKKSYNFSKVSTAKKSYTINNDYDEKFIMD